MIGAYAYTPDIWPPLAAAIFVATLGLYAWRRRNAPAVGPFAAISLFASLLMLGIALEAAAVAPATKFAWYKFQFLMQVLAVTGGTCFTLEYTYPGRWLTRRNLTLLALPPLLCLLLIIIDDSQLIWRRLEVGSDGSVVPYYAIPGAILLAYAWSLFLLNAAAFLWLFIRSPQHRWPAALMLFGQVTGRLVYLIDVARLPWLTPLDPLVAATLAPWMMYAIALFGFRIFDPLPTARAMALEQMREGMVVLDSSWRVANLNPAAAEMLSTSATHARGKLLGELLSAFPDVAARLTGAAAEPVEISLGAGPKARFCALELSLLKDFRGPIIGRLLLLRDVAEQRRTQAQIVEQQRTLAVLQERERLARELHDGLGQALAATHLQATTAKLLLARGEATQANECLDNLADTTLQAEADVREYLLGARAAFSAGQPFFPALRQYVARFSQQYDLPVELSAPPQLETQGFGTAVEVQLLRIIQEALSNVRKHARATSVQVFFAQKDRTVCIDIIDDGQGFEPANRRADSFGLQAMRERAETLGGHFEVISQPGQGTRVIVQVPVQVRQEAISRKVIR